MNIHKTIAVQVITVIPHLTNTIHVMLLMITIIYWTKELHSTTIPDLLELWRQDEAYMTQCL